MYGTDPTVTADGPLPVQRPNLLTLNWDVLWHIFAHLTRGDVIQLGKTCHAAHTISWPYVLAEVALSEPSQVLPFCTYMLSDAEHRLPLLRSLKIRQGTFLDTWKSPNAWDFSVAEHLARLMLRLSTTLRELYVQDAEKIFCSLPRIADAVIALTRLEVFRLEGALQESATVLSRMRSRPHSVDWDARLYERWPSLPGLGSLLSLTPEQQQAVAFGEGPCHILRNFATSLTTLKLRDLCRTITAYEPDIVWHAVKTLELYKQSIGFDVPPAAVMVELSRAFPNLQCLRVTGNMGIAPHPVNAVQESGCWPYLDFVSTISPMPVVRTVRRLELHNSADRVPFYVQEHTCEEFLRLSAPVVLACGADEEILQSIHAAAIPSLRFLQLFFYPITRGSLPERHAVHMQHILVRIRLPPKSFVLGHSIFTQLCHRLGHGLPKVEGHTTPCRHDVHQRCI